jgi:hypothetical protein
MAVTGISQPPVAPPDSTLDLASRRAQHAGSKANTAQATGGVSPAQQAEETKPRRRRKITSGRNRVAVRTTVAKAATLIVRAGF